MIIRFIGYAFGAFISSTSVSSPEVAGAVFVGMVVGDICASTLQCRDSE